jgi:DNA-binding transcriptional LysR family regulator
VRADDRFATEPVGQHRGRFFRHPGHPALQRGPVELAGLFEFPSVASRLPSRVPANLPQTCGRAGRVDALSGDFVPAIEIDAPLALAELLANSDALAIASLALMERDLEAGAVRPVPTTGISFHAAYGFIFLKDRSLTPAAQAYMQEVLAVEVDIVRREEVLASRFGELR